MLSWSKPSGLDPRQAAVDLLGHVGAAVLAQDLVVEVLDAETESSDADASRIASSFGERAGLALERDFLDAVPVEDWRTQPARRASRRCLG